MHLMKIWLCLQVVHLLYSTAESASVPQFKVDLDLPPEQRFLEITNHFKGEMQAMHKRFGVILDGYMSKEEQKEWSDVLDTIVSDEITAETWGVAKALGYKKGTRNWSNMRLGGVMYELGSPSAFAKGPECTGLLMAQPDGTVLHGRNMDFIFKFKMPDGKVKDLQDLTCEVIWYKNGKPLFQTTGFAADSSVNTGMRFDGWTYETNSRCGGKDSMRQNLQNAKKGGVLSGHYVRKMMEETPDYETAKQNFWKAKLVAPIYMIMSGAGHYEGTVLALDALAEHLTTSPHPAELRQTPNRWHLVQTNDDRPSHPKRGDWKKQVDVRRPLAQAMLAGVTQKAVSQEAVENFMHTPFVFNTDTVFSTVMSAKTGWFKTFLPTDAPHIQDAIRSTELLAKSTEDGQMSKEQNETRAQIFAAVVKLVGEDPGGGDYFKALKAPTPEFLRGVRTIAYLAGRLSDREAEARDIEETDSSALASSHTHEYENGQDDHEDHNLHDEHDDHEHHDKNQHDHDDAHSVHSDHEALDDQEHLEHHEEDHDVDSIKI